MTTVQSIERAVAVLSEIADRGGRLSDIAERVELPVSTTGRLLATLEHTATVTRGDDGVYDIGPAIHEMVEAAVPIPAAPPELASFRHLAALAEETGEAVGLCLPFGDRIQCVAQFDAPKPVRAEDWTGRSWALHLGGSGIVTLASYHQSALDAYFLDHAEADEIAVRRRIQRAAVDGWCWSHGDYQDGLSSIAAPVCSPDDRVVAAIYLYGPTYRFPGDRDAVSRFERVVSDRARDLSDEMRPAP
jgi:DNA-binding IclR family transcriptional regulator